MCVQVYVQVVVCATACVQVCKCVCVLSSRLWCVGVCVCVCVCVQVDEIHRSDAAPVDMCRRRSVWCISVQRFSTLTYLTSNVAERRNVQSSVDNVTCLLVVRC